MAKKKLGGEVLEERADHFARWCEKVGMVLGDN